MRQLLATLNARVARGASGSVSRECVVSQLGPDGSSGSESYGVAHSLGDFLPPGLARNVVGALIADGRIARGIDDAGNPVPLRMVQSGTVRSDGPVTSLSFTAMRPTGGTSPEPDDDGLGE